MWLELYFNTLDTSEGVGENREVMAVDKYKYKPTIFDYVEKKKSLTLEAKNGITVRLWEKGGLCHQELICNGQITAILSSTLDCGICFFQVNRLLHTFKQKDLTDSQKAKIRKWIKKRSNK